MYPTYITNNNTAHHLTDKTQCYRQHRNIHFMSNIAFFPIYPLSVFICTYNSFNRCIPTIYDLMEKLPPDGISCRKASDWKQSVLLKHVSPTQLEKKKRKCVIYVVCCVIGLYSQMHARLLTVRMALVNRR